MSKEVWINLGCGIRLFKDFINVDSAFDLEDLKKKEGIFKNAVIEKGAQFVRADMQQLPFPDNYADYILSHYSIEHLPINGVVSALREWMRVLKPTGELYIATIDFDCLMEMWQKLCHTSVEDWKGNEFVDIAQMIYGNQITAGEFHCCPFNLKSMNMMLSLAGIPYWESRLVAAFSPPPPIKGYIKRSGVVTCAEIHIRARKTIPKQKGKKK